VQKIAQFFIDRIGINSDNKQKYSKLMNTLSTMASECSLKILKQEFKIGKKIDEGAFGKIYKGTSLRGGCS